MGKKEHTRTLKASILYQWAKFFQSHRRGILRILLHQLLIWMDERRLPGSLKTVTDNVMSAM